MLSLQTSLQYISLISITSFGNSKQSSFFEELLCLL